MKKEKRIRIPRERKAVLFRCIGSVFMVLTLLFDLFLLGNVVATDVNGTVTELDTFNTFGLETEYSFGLMLMMMGMFELLRFAYSRLMEKKMKKDFFWLLYAVLCFIASILGFCAKAAPILSGIAALVAFCPFFIRRGLHLKEHRKKVRYVVLDSIMFILMSIVVLFVLVTMENPVTPMLITGAIAFFFSLLGICQSALSNFDLKVLKKVIRQTYAEEILFSMMLLVVAFSMVLMRIETSINTFDDGLWYCFMLITTIGFGDLTVVTVLGRVLSVILGLYGIVVVSILTSIIVNFYNEIKAEREKRGITDEESALPGATEEKQEEPAPESEQPEEKTVEPEKEEVPEQTTEEK